MTQQQEQALFSKEMAGKYEKGRGELQSLKDTMYLMLRGALSGLPDEARILVVGAGTGEDVLYLARHWPGWRFTVVEPAAAMMKICREKIEAAGIGERCDFHEGYLDTLCDAGPYGAAVSILVSHFVTEHADRVAFFREIANRLEPGGLLYTGDLLINRNHTGADALLEVWFYLLRSSDLAPEQVEKMISFKGAWIMPPGDYTALVEEAGFCEPLQLFQGGLMTGWQFTRA